MPRRTTKKLPSWFPRFANVSRMRWEKPLMPAYVLVDLEVKDAAGIQEYGRNAAPIIRKHGGEYLAVSDAPRVLEGNWRPHRIVLVRFPNLQAVDAFISDPEYAPWKALRLRVTTGSMIAFEGMQG
jgi:uncharacterized protein (DUF1330 family)